MKVFRSPAQACPPLADDGIEHGVHELRVDQVAFGLDHLGHGATGCHAGL